jgi:hypothetical protein
MYTSTNFKTKKALKNAVAAWNAEVKAGKAGAPRDAENPTPAQPVTLWAPGLGEPKANGTEYVEGPHYPKPHTWYAQVEVKDGIVVGVK